MALSNVGENQPLTPSSSLLESMATLGLAARNEGVTLTNTGVQSSLPILEHEIIEQVAQKLSVQKLNLNGKESVTLELEPKELGALKIEISVHKGSITAEILTQHPIVKEILEKNLYLLHDGLKQSGFNIDQFSVNVGDFRNQSDSKWNQETFHFSDRQASNYSADPVLAVAGGMGSSSFFGGSEVSLYI
jgi:flagellar hook-length control protein FliK